MAGDWIKIEHALPGKPEVMELARLLDIDEMAVVGHLVCFWSWVDQNLSPDCPAVTGTRSGLDRVSGRDGFVDAMITVGWMQFDGHTVTVPNYDHHLSASAKKRGLETRKKQRQRNLSPKCPDVVPQVTGQNGGLEKRREEKIEQTQDANASGGGGSAPKKRTRAAFQKPTLAEITAYIQEIGATIDGSEWFDHYEANGWKVGRNAMKDWKATVRGWESRRKASGNGAKSTNGHTNDAWGRVCAGFKKHDLECDRAALEAFIGPELWKAVRAVGPRNIMEMTTFTKSAVQKEFEAALRGGT